MSAVGHALHLARRFVGALDPRGPAPADEAWAVGLLGAGERALWGRMSGPDRRHAVGVARDVQRRLAPSAASPPVLAAALLHDVGKVDAGLGTIARVPATVAGLVARERIAAGDGRVARYLRHDLIGADLLAAAGADRLTIAWAREHHLAPERWTLPPEVAAALKAADDD